MRRVLQQHDVVHSVETLGQLLVKLNEDILCQFGISRDIAQAAAEQDLAGRGDVGSLDDAPINTTIEAVTYFLSHLGEVTVKVVAVMCIDTFAQIGDILIRRTHINSVGAAQRSVGVVRSGRAGEDVHFEWTAGLVFGHSTRCEGLGDKFGRSGGGEA